MRKKNIVDNTRYKIIPLEKFQLEEIYSFTINIDGEYNKKVLPHAFADNDLKILLAKLSNNWKYKLFREISPVPNCKIHYHGLIVCMDSEYSVRIDLYKELSKLCENAAIEIDTIGNMDVWYEYCTKQVFYWAECGEEYNPIISNFTLDLETELAVLRKGGDDENEEEEEDSDDSGEYEGFSADENISNDDSDE